MVCYKKKMKKVVSMILVKKTKISNSPLMKIMNYLKNTLEIKMIILSQMITIMIQTRTIMINNNMKIIKTKWVKISTNKIRQIKIM